METLGFAYVLLHAIFAICSGGEVNKKTRAHKGRIISIALSNNWGFSLTLQENATNDSSFKVSFSVESEII